jgi:hypothetical protein
MIHTSTTRDQPTLYTVFDLPILKAAKNIVNKNFYPLASIKKLKVLHP